MHNGVDWKDAAVLVNETMAQGLGRGLMSQGAGGYAFSLEQGRINEVARDQEYIVAPVLP